MTTGTSDTSETPLNVLVVDDDPSSRDAIAFAAEALGHRADAVADSTEALTRADTKLYDLAMVDLRLGSESGLDLVPRLLEQCPWMKVAVITAHGSIERAVRAMQRGAVDFVEKPVSPRQLEALARNISAVRDLERDIEHLRDDLERAVPPPRMQSGSRAMREVYSVARRAAASDATILLRGESGTGKGVLARAIHGWSDRSDRPFGTVSAPTLSKELLESELFGHVKGAFTGAVRSRPGRISRTDGGTLFLDEIGTMPVELQPKLLRFLQDRAFERVGGDETHHADVRLIVATNHDLEAEIEAGGFREDLYFRIRVIEIEVPPLRERAEDIIPLAESFVDFFAARYGRRGARLTDAAARALRERPWPGNVRELQNAIERAVILGSGRSVGADALPSSDPVLGSAALDGTPMVSLDEAEKRHIEGVLAATSSAKEAAKVLGVSTTTLWRRRRKHDL